MASSKKPEVYTTPPGTAIWPWINKPDDRPIKGKPQKPAFKLNIQYDANSPAWLSLKEQIDRLVDESYEKALEESPKKKKVISRGYPYSLDVDDDGEETGTVTLKLKQSAFIKKKDGQVEAVRIPKFDAAGTIMNNSIMVYGGSTVKATFSTRPYLVDSTDKAGVSLDLKAVQVLKLISNTQRDASSYGFGREEGYDATEDNSKEESTVSSGNDDVDALGDEDDPTAF